jgi:hypothetical protein
MSNCRSCHELYLSQIFLCKQVLPMQTKKKFMKFFQKINTSGVAKQELKKLTGKKNNLK